MLSAIEFFAGSGLVRLGMQGEFETVWANDNSPKKRDTYVANHGSEVFHLGDICDVRGEQLPSADVAWASFPCQDLSLAGNMTGMGSDTRSGLFWEWIRVLWEQRANGTLPPVLVAENVVGFLVADQGLHFRQAYEALRELGYRAGGIVVNASIFVPQSRPRAFIVAVRDGIDLSGLVEVSPTLPFHTAALAQASMWINDPKWVWWSLPIPPARKLVFSDICERHVEVDKPDKTCQLLEMLSPLNRQKLEQVKALNRFFAGTAYRRTRPDGFGKTIQRLETRFDGLAGCLRTPNGGSSRQTVLLAEDGRIKSRLLSIRECARLMGAPESFKLPINYNDGYRAMGDGVAVPVARWISRHLLAPLSARASGQNCPVSVESGLDEFILPAREGWLLGLDCDA